MADETAPAIEATAVAPKPAGPAKADPMAAVMAYITGELSAPALAHAKTVAADQIAFLKHLEAQLPMASFGKVQAMLGLEL